MWMMLQQEQPDDYVLATGESHAVREFVERAFAEIGVPIEWKGKGVSEKGIDAKSGRTLVEVDERYFRPTEVEHLCGDASKAHQRLGWRHETDFEALVSEMVREDLVAIQREHRRRDD
jgi:GDPmannose 4,6-dehydratase